MIQQELERASQTAAVAPLSDPVQATRSASLGSLSSFSEAMGSPAMAVQGPHQTKQVHCYKGLFYLHEEANPTSPSRARERQCDKGEAGVARAEEVSLQWET